MKSILVSLAFFLQKEQANVTMTITPFIGVLETEM